jgi:hypothetical protein
MLVLAITLGALSAQAPCRPTANALLDEAAKRAAAFDLPGAAAKLRDPTGRGCTDVELSALYVQGLLDAREAFRQGAPPAALEPVYRAIARLDALAGGRSGPAEIARRVLHAAAAAAQSERDEMRVYLEAAERMERLQRAAGQPGAPVVSAAEIAGDLWFQVHQYENARRAYAAAATEVGATPRGLAGSARTAAKLGDVTGACAAFRELVQRWHSASALPPEIVEARAYLDQHACSPVVQR